MTIFKDFAFTLQLDAIYRQLGYRQVADVSEEIRVYVERCREVALAAVKACAAYEYCQVKIDSDVVIVEIGRMDSLGRDGLKSDGVKFCGQWLAARLNKAEEIVAAVLTAGDGIEQLAEQSFASGDPLSGVVYDAIGTVVLFEMQQQFWQKISADAKLKGYGLVGPLSPGTSGWATEEQATIYHLVHGQKVGIALTTGGMMVPVKSVSVLYGLGPAVQADDEFNLCRYCTSPCQARGDMCAKKFGVAGSGSNFSSNGQEWVNITCTQDGQTKLITALRGENLLSTLRVNGYHVAAPCGGRGTCGKCKVKIVEKSHQAEIIAHKQLMAVELAGGYRLACHFTVQTDLEVILPAAEKGVILTATGSSKLPLSHIEPMPGYGIAIDIGTTTVVAYLVNLSTGEEIALTSHLNPQRQFGGDVVSRISYTETQTAGLEILQTTIVDLLNQMIEELCSVNLLKLEEIKKVVIVGNPVMIHILLGVPCSSLGVAPYTPLLIARWEGRGRELGFKLHPQTAILIPAGIAGYVGADITAGILASGLFRSDEYEVLLDIGTNGEIVLGRKGEMYACAAAAGPAFEGAGIQCGVGGIAGAISAVQFSGSPVYTTLGGEKPLGICGSGILDGVAELLKAGIVDPTGRMEAGQDSVVTTPNGLAFILASEQESGQEGSPIVLTQKDIRQVQLAKGAIRAGLEVLLRRAGITHKQVKSIYLAGGFGNYLRIGSAVRVGLLPSEWEGRVLPVGNSAGTGAKLLLQNQSYFAVIDSFVKNTSYIELTTEPDFQELFVEHMLFPE